MILVAALLMLAYFIIRTLIANRTEKTWRKILLKSFSSTEWGPADPHRREEYRKFKELKRSEKNVSLTKWQTIVALFTGRSYS